MAYDYWAESVQDALNDAGIDYSPEQLKDMIQFIKLSVEHEGMATGAHNIPNPLTSEMAQLEARHKKEVEELQRQISVFTRSVARRNNVEPQDVYLEGDTVLVRV